MASNGLRDQDRLEGASNYVIWKSRIEFLLDEHCWPHFVNDPIAVHPPFFQMGFFLFDVVAPFRFHHPDFIDSWHCYKWCKPISTFYDVNDLSKTVHVCNNLGKPSMLLMTSILGGFLSHWFTKVIGRVFPSSLTPKLGWILSSAY